MYMKNLHWFMLFLLPISYGSSFLTQTLMPGHPYFFLVLNALISFLLVIIIIVLIDKIHNEDTRKKDVAVKSIKHFLPIAGFNFLFIMIVFVMGVVVAMVGKSPFLGLLTAIGFIIAVIYLSLRWSLTQVAIVTEDLGAVEGMKRSSDMMMGYKMPMFIMMLALMAVIALILYAEYLYLGATNLASFQILMYLNPNVALFFAVLINLYVPVIIIHIYYFYQRRLILLEEEEIAENEQTNLS